MSKIYIDGIRAQTILGVREHEKKTPQLISVDLSFSVDIDRAASHDRLADTHDYSTIAQSTLDFVTFARYQLLETLVKQLKNHLQKTFQLHELKIVITKKPNDMPFVDGVRVVVDSR